MISNKHKSLVSGFSHFELALVIIFIAILSTVGLYVYKYNTDRSKAGCSNFYGSCINDKKSNNENFYTTSTPKKTTSTPKKTTTTKSTVSTGSNTSSSSSSSSSNGGTAYTPPPPPSWSLTGISKRSAHYHSAGAKAGFFHDVKNNGPSTATYKWYVASGWFDNQYRWKNKGDDWKRVSEIHTETTSSGDHKPSLTRGDAHFLNTEIKIPENARDGDHFCQVIFFSRAGGPNEDINKYNGNSEWKKSCVTVIKPKSYTKVMAAPADPVKVEACWKQYNADILRLKITANIPGDYAKIPGAYRIYVGSKANTKDIGTRSIDRVPADATKADLTKTKASAGTYVGIGEFNTKAFEKRDYDLWINLNYQPVAGLPTVGKLAIAHVDTNTYAHCPPEDIRPQYFVSTNSSTKGSVPNPAGTVNKNKSNNAGTVYPHAYYRLTRVFHIYDSKNKVVMNYDVWWKNKDKKTLVVQYRVNMPKNSNLIPGKFYAKVYTPTADGKKIKNQIAASNIVKPLDESSSKNATSKQVNSKKAPAGRYWGEIHITREQMQGNNVLYFESGYSGTDKQARQAFNSIQAIDVNKVYWITNGASGDTIHSGRARLPFLANEL